MIFESTGYCPALHLGDVFKTKNYPLGIVPSGRHAVRISAIHLLTTRTLAPNPSDYWLLTLGAVTENGLFDARALIPLDTSGLIENRFLGRALLPQAVFKPTEAIVLRAETRGQPSPIEGFVVAVDSVTLSVRS